MWTAQFIVIKRVNYQHALEIHSYLTMIGLYILQQKKHKLTCQKGACKNIIIIGNTSHLELIFDSNASHQAAAYGVYAFINMKGTQSTDPAIFNITCKGYVSIYPLHKTQNMQPFVSQIDIIYQLLLCFFYLVLTFAGMEHVKLLNSTFQ